MYIREITKQEKENIYNIFIHSPFQEISYESLKYVRSKCYLGYLTITRILEEYNIPKSGLHPNVFIIMGENVR